MEESKIIYPQKIRDIQSVAYEYNEVYKSFEQITFILEFQKIDFYSLDDTDEILIKVSEIDNCVEMPYNSILKHLLGKSIFTTWKCINAQGYFDLFILGIDSIQPTISILSEGSSLKILESPTYSS